jgi:uncharacterized membrane protein
MTDDLKNLAAEMRRRRVPPRYFAAQAKRGLSPQEIFAAWPVQTHVDRIGSRRSRRLLVIATYGGWLLVALLTKPLSSPRLHFPVVAFVLLANAFATVILLNRRTFPNREVLAGDSGLDERLVQSRNHAFRVAFQVFALVALAAWAVSVTLVHQPGDALLIYLGAALLAATLPTVIWAWREPDPPEPEPLAG